MSNLARTFVNGDTNERNAKLGQSGSESGHVTYFWNFGTPLPISRERLEVEMSNLACRFITRGTNERNAKLGQRGSERGHVTYFWNFVTPSISREWLELETSHFACRFITRGTNERNAKLSQWGLGRGHVTYYWNFGTPSISHAGTVVDDNASQWKSGKFDPLSLRNPWTDRQQNLRGWLRWEPLPLCKILSRYDYRTLPPKYAKMCIKWLSFFVGSSDSLQPRPLHRFFHDQYVKWRSFAQGCAFCGSRKQNFTFRPHFPPKPQIFGQFSTGLRKFRVKKALTVGMLPCKLPLIVIVAQWKLYSE